MLLPVVCDANYDDVCDDVFDAVRYAVCAAVCVDRPADT